MTQVLLFAASGPRVRRIPPDRPWLWLAKGLDDLRRAPDVSLAYGLGLAAVSIVLTAGLAVFGLYYLILPLTAGFFLIAPLLAVGLYEASRRLEIGLPVAFGTTVGAWRRNPTQIGLMGVMLLLIHLFWVRVATLLFALFFHEQAPGLEALIDALFFSPVSLPFLITGSLIGAAFAALVFSIGAISIPMLLDRDVHVVAAMTTSWSAVLANWKPMALWAALIVVLTVLGFATFCLGLAIALPLVGHATWHAYRDLVS
ncbi:MAG TPA: DUF2189 domain-containing protein [Alphaproteobacteria bacterium]